MTQNHKSMKMHKQNDALSDPPKSILSLFLIIFNSCSDFSNKYVYRYRTTVSCFAENTYFFLNNENKKSLTVLSHIYIPRTVTEDAREQFYVFLVILFLFLYGPLLHFFFEHVFN